MQHGESWVSTGPKHTSKAGNLVFGENEYSAEPKGGQNKIADIFTITMVCRRFGFIVMCRNCSKKHNSTRFFTGKMRFFKTLWHRSSFYRFQTFGMDNLQPGLLSIIQQNRIRSWYARAIPHTTPQMSMEGRILFSHCKGVLSTENDDVGCL